MVGAEAGCLQASQVALWTWVIFVSAVQASSFTLYGKRTTNKEIFLLSLDFCDPFPLELMWRAQATTQQSIMR